MAGWCPSCESEWWTGRRCPDCGADLLAERPSIAVDDGEQDHSIVAYDMRSLDDGMRWQLGLRLDAAGVGHTWAGDTLWAPVTADRFVDEVTSAAHLAPAPEATGSWNQPFVEPTDADEQIDQPVFVASPWRRLAGYLLDSLVWVVLAVAFSHFTWTRRAGELPTWGHWWTFASVAIEAAYVIVSIGSFDRTLGQAAVGMRVVTPDGTSPGYRRAIVRWLVVAPASIGVLVPYLTIRHSNVLPYLTIRHSNLRVDPWGFWLLIVYIPILFDRLNRGLHDRAAGTVVVVVTHPGRRRGPRT